ncbi:MAG: hypothetical protein AB1568_13590 [Thermodesulfobacteriota bacterium]
MEQLTGERLQDNLTRLKLGRAAEVHDIIVREVEENKSSYMAFLDHLLEEEVACCSNPERSIPACFGQE